MEGEFSADESSQADSDSSNDKEISDGTISSDEEQNESPFEVNNESSDGELSSEDEQDHGIQSSSSKAPLKKKRRVVLPGYLKKLLNNNIDTALSVSERNRGKIIEKKYMDFASLINKKKGDALTFSEWSEAFNIFGIIHAAQYPEEAFLLFYHADLIRQAHASSNRWLDYDIAFRKKMDLVHGDGHSLSSSNLMWGHTDEGLWRKFILSPSTALNIVNEGPSSSSSRSVFHVTSSSQQPTNPLASFNPYIQGWCVAFNKFPAGCNKPRCQFKHECARCHQPREILPQEQQLT